MDTLTQQLMQQLAGGGLSQISQQIGAKEEDTGSAMSMAIPLLMSALANNASKPEGAQSLQQALANDHDGSVLNNLPGLLSNPQAANGAGILGHVLGAQQPAVTQGLAQNTGLGSDQVSQLLQIAAPLVMGSLGQQQQQQGFDINGLSAFLGAQQQAERQTNPDMVSMLNTLLDTNRSGSALDEILGMVARFFGRK
ncbi:MAG: DUF937 domain-containing protein [Thermoflexales bacterium]|nr:DUF937 domain-containing protein [Thermoflexales bacterium]